MLSVRSKWNLNILPKVIGSAVRDLNEIEGKMIVVCQARPSRCADRGGAES